MPRVAALLFRLLLPSLLISFAISFLLWAIAGYWVSGIGWEIWLSGPVLFLALGLGLVSAAEAGFLRALGAAEEWPPGLEHSLRRALARLPGPLPRIRVYVSPRPRFWIARSLGGNGVILVSQGLLSLLSEAELRAVLRWSAERCREPGLALQSACGLAALGLFRLAPRGWNSVALTGGLPVESPASASAPVSLLNPISALWFLAIYPTADYFFRLSHLRPNLDSRPIREGTPHLISATRKTARALQAWPGARLSGA